MSPELIGIIIVGLTNAASLAFLWALHRDVAGLQERVARLEERVAGLVERIVRLEERMERVEERLSRLEGLFERFTHRVRTTGESDTGT